MTEELNGAVSLHYSVQKYQKLTSLDKKGCFSFHPATLLQKIKEKQLQCTAQAVSLQNAINRFSKIESNLIVVLIGKEHELETITFYLNFNLAIIGFSSVYKMKA